MTTASTPQLPAARITLNRFTKGYSVTLPARRLDMGFKTIAEAIDATLRVTAVSRIDLPMAGDNRGAIALGGAR